MNLKKMQEAGAKLANIAFNLAESPAAATPTVTVELLTAARLEWDAACMEPTGIPAPAGGALLEQPCRCCHGTKKSCTMNCGLPLGDKRTRADMLSQCDDCDTCSCRWNRIGGLQSVVTTATEILPAGYRLSIDVDRDRCTTSIINPQGERRVIDSEGYLADDVRAAIDKALAAEAPRKLW